MPEIRKSATHSSGDYAAGYFQGVNSPDIYVELGSKSTDYREGFRRGLIVARAKTKRAGNPVYVKRCLMAIAAVTFFAMPWQMACGGALMIGLCAWTLKRPR